MSLHKTGYFPESNYISKKIRFELDLSDYVIKSKLKNATGVNTSKFAKEKLI